MQKNWKLEKEKVKSDSRLQTTDFFVDGSTNFLPSHSTSTLADDSPSWMMEKPSLQSTEQTSVALNGPARCKMFWRVTRKLHEDEKMSRLTGTHVYREEAFPALTGDHSVLDVRKFATSRCVRALFTALVTVDWNREKIQHS